MPDDDLLIGPELPEDGPPLRFAASGVPGGVADARWQWYSPVFRLVWHPCAFNPPGWGQALDRLTEHKRDPEAEGNTSWCHPALLPLPGAMIAENRGKFPLSGGIAQGPC
jgi:hypothetical protein